MANTANWIQRLANYVRGLRQLRRDLEARSLDSEGDLGEGAAIVASALEELHEDLEALAKHFPALEIRLIQGEQSTEKIELTVENRFLQIHAEADCLLGDRGPTTSDTDSQASSL